MISPRMAIGVPIEGDPTRLETTLVSLRRNGSSAPEIVFIPDGAGDDVRGALASVDARVLDDRGARGGAAALNRLFRETEADIVVLLESGAIVAPRWLDHLLAVLASSPRAGLAGPSTNRSWNEQAAFQNAGGSTEDVMRTGLDAERRFGSTARTLAPLYSLGDFCYAVRRTVFDAIGDADEGYGLGPCWEMDYNVRAARAGFDGLWVCGAYVWRAPFTPRREREEAARFDASRHRYQDKFCGARLRGVKTDYREHCRGDACPNFAPRPRPALASSDQPLVSCIMPTHDRRAFVPQALACFTGQDYPNLELIVVDDGADSVADLLPSDPRIQYVRLGQRLSIGAKRNHACERARGEFIVHWDDDDWYPRTRVSTQVRAMADAGADVCGTSVLYYFDRERERAFCYRYSGPPSAWVAGNTLAYRRDFWMRNRFADVQVGEDSQFVWACRHERLVDLRDPTLCVGSIHAGNISPKETGGVFWCSESVARIQDVIRAGTPASPPSALPLVSCIMPTYNRRAFIGLALASFREQSYANRELVVVDDGPDAIADLVAGQPAVRYMRLEKRISIGAKRNLACGAASGEIIAHWDDDDWYAPDRLEIQTAPILRGDADITGLENRFVLQMPQRKFWTIDRRLHQSMFVGDVHGGTIVFRRSIWTNGTRYPDADLAEDAMLLQQAVRRGMRIVRLENHGTFVYLRHRRNAWQFETGKFLDPKGWSETIPPPAFTHERLEAYGLAAASLAAAG